MMIIVTTTRKAVGFIMWVVPCAYKKKQDLASVCSIIFFQREYENLCMINTEVRKTYAFVLDKLPENERE